MLLESKAELKNDAKNGTYPLNVAMRNGKMEIASLLIQNGTENRKDSGGDSFLVHCVKTNNLDMIKLFCRHGGEFYKIEGEEHPREIAARGNNPEMANYLKLNLEFELGVHHAELNSAPLSILTDENTSVDEKKIAIENTVCFQYEDNISHFALEEVLKWNKVHTDAKIKIRERGMGKNKVKARISDGAVSSFGLQTVTGVRIGYNRTTIHSLQFLYGEKAGEIHKTGDKKSGVEIEEIRVEAPITRIITKHGKYGDLNSLEVRP